MARRQFIHNEWGPRQIDPIESSVAGIGCRDGAPEISISQQFGNGHLTIARLEADSPLLQPLSDAVQQGRPCRFFQIEGALHADHAVDTAILRLH